MTAARSASIKPFFPQAETYPAQQCNIRPLAEPTSAYRWPASAAAATAVSSPLDFLIHEGGASSLTDAAYRFARHEPGADVALFGTGDQTHLRRNVESLLKPPLPPADVETLHRLFVHLHGVGLVFPDKSSTEIRLSSIAPPD